MPSIHVPFVNIALDAFALLVMLILFASCISEYSVKKAGSIHFLILQISIIAALIFDMLGWFGEGHPELSVLTVLANTLSACAVQIVVISLMSYLVASLYANSRAAVQILMIFRVLCVLSAFLCIGNAFFGYSYQLDAGGHWQRVCNLWGGFAYLIFPILSLITVILMIFLAKRSAKINRAVYVIYALVPIVGVIVDYVVHGISLTYVCFTVSILLIYTSIYLTRKKQLEAQKNALMLSQINPHFVYNTLSTIASMCDTSPKQAKNLTIDFARYLRENINSLTSEEMIPFDREMDHVACYLKIERARFGERLNVVYAIRCKEFTIPPLTVQPLVENAVKHGITKKPGGGTVKISTFEEDSHYVIEIIDDGVGFDTEKVDMHVGIENARSRLAAMCKGDITVKSTLGVGTRVSILIPKKKGKR